METIVNDAPDYRQAPAKTALSGEASQGPQNVVLSSPDQALPTSSRPGWMTMRMIVNGKTKKLRVFLSFSVMGQSE